MPEVPRIHLCNWAQQPDLHILCEDRWTSPAWVGHPGDGVYLDDDGKLYTFEKSKVTCLECISNAAFEKDRG